MTLLFLTFFAVPAAYFLWLAIDLVRRERAHNRRMRDLEW